MLQVVYIGHQLQGMGFKGCQQYAGTDAHTDQTIIPQFCIQMPQGEADTDLLVIRHAFHFKNLGEGNHTIGIFQQPICGFHQQMQGSIPFEHRFSVHQTAVRKPQFSPGCCNCRVAGKIRQIHIIHQGKFPAMDSSGNRHRMGSSQLLQMAVILGKAAGQTQGIGDKYPAGDGQGSGD